MKARIGLDIVDVISGRHVEYNHSWCVVCFLAPYEPPRVIATCETSLLAEKIKRATEVDKSGCTFKVMAIDFDEGGSR